MTWSANLLQKGYIRRIIGYDLRIDNNWLEGNIHATIDNQIWPQFEQIDKLSAQCNGFNLFDQLDDNIISISKEEKILIVAFDMPLDLANLLSSTFGLVPQKIDILSNDKDWHLLGFDIVDFRTQCSAFYSFDWIKIDKEEVLRKFSFQLNYYGLVQNESDAIDAACVYDKKVPEHSPFSPCGVWVKNWRVAPARIAGVAKGHRMC